MTKTQFINAEKVAEEFPDGVTLGFAGFGGMGQCDEVIKAIRDRFLKTGHPKNLTIFHASGQSNRENGIEYLAYEGLISKIVGGHWGLAPKTRTLIEENKVEVHCLPQGQLTHLFRTMANGLPGHFSTVGLGTFVDPRIEGGKFNDRAKVQNDGQVELIEILGKEYLFYKSVFLDYVLIRGTFIDEHGNLSVEEEPLKMEVLSAAQAAKANGGKVIAQVKYVVKSETIHPKRVAVPGYLIDYAVIVNNPEENHRQVPSATYHPKYSGDIRVPVDEIDPLPLSIRKIIGLRAVKELTKNAVVNLGIGIPGDIIGPIAAEEGLLDDVTLTIESGTIGGVPAGKNEFGIAINAEAIIDHAYQFDYYHGTGVDLTFMGAAQVDQEGNVNVSKFGGRLIGCGGFIDVTQPAKKVIFCTTFTNGGLEVAIENGELKIIREGENKKFVSSVDQITFSGVYASRVQHKPVLYITERAVFELTGNGLELIEIAPGIDLEQDVLGQMKIRPQISEDLKLMDIRIFRGELVEDSGSI